MPTPTDKQNEGLTINKKGIMGHGSIKNVQKEFSNMVKSIYTDLGPNQGKSIASCFNLKNCRYVYLKQRLWIRHAGQLHEGADRRAINQLRRMLLIIFHLCLAHLGIIL